MWISNSRLGVSLIPSANGKHSMALRRYSSAAMNLPQVLKDALALATSEMSAPKHPRHLVTNAFPGGTTTPKVGVVLCELHFWGPWPGVYRFTAGRLVSIERAPAAREPSAKAATRSKKPAGS